MRIIITLLLAFFSSFLFGQNHIEIVQNYLKEKVVKEVIFVSIKKQKLYYIKNNKTISEYIISSSAYGTGNKAGSNKTPLGLHKVKYKYGDNTPINGRMIARVYTGEIATVYKDSTKSNTDDVTTRILWLEGLEQGENKGEGIDSFKRYIYIHGTSEEGRLGTPASHGCIRMKNKEVIDLYNKVAIGTLVLIL